MDYAATDALLNHLRDAWRSRWWGLLAAAIICAVSWTVVFLLPKVYEAKASVYVNTSSSLAPLLKGLAVESDLDSQLELVNQLLLSREVLEAVVTQTHPYAGKSLATDMDLVIADLRQRLKLTGGRRAGRDNLYVITFRDSDRNRAVSVVSSLLTHFIQKTIGVKLRATGSAEKFLLAQKQEYESRLSTAENQLAEFKRQNMGMLPGERTDYFSQLQRELEARRIAQVHLDQFHSQRDQIKKQLAGESPVTTLPGAGTDPGSVIGAAGSAAANPIDRRIVDAENKLSEMRLQWTNEHPDVIAQRQLLERLRAERLTYLKALGVKGKHEGPISIESNPVYGSLRMALSQVELKMFELTAEISSESTTIAQLEHVAGTVPKVEAQYQQLNRDYNVLNAEYQEVVKRLETARLSGEAEQSENVDFRIIQPAAAGIAPVAPKRLLLLPGVFIVSVALGFWIALVRSRMTPVFYTLEEISRGTQLLLLGAVGNVAPAMVARKKLRSAMSFAAVSVAFVALLGIAMANELLLNAGAPLFGAAGL